MSRGTTANPTRAKFLLALGVLLFAIGQSLTFIIVGPLAPTVGFTEQSYGITLTVASLPLIFGAPFWGRRSEHIGRKPVFVIGVAGSAVGTLLVALVLQAGLAKWVAGIGLLVMLGLARSAYGSVASAIYPSATAYMIDVTDETNRSKGLALMGAANGMGSILGPIMVALLAFFGPLVPMYAACLIGLAGAWMAWRLLPEPDRHAASRRQSTLRITDPRLRPFMVMWATFFMTFVALQVVLGFYLQDQFGIADPKARIQLSSIMLISMATAIVVAQIGVLQAFHVRPPTLLRAMGPLFCLSLVVIALAPSTVMVAVGFGILGLSFACANPGINGSASLCVEPWEQGPMAGYLSAANTCGAILGPLVGTQIYHHLGHQALMWVGAAVFVAVSLYALTIKVPARSPGQAAASGG